VTFGRGKIWTGFWKRAQTLENVATICFRANVFVKIFTSHIQIIVFSGPREQQTERTMLKSTSQDFSDFLQQQTVNLTASANTVETMSAPASITICANSGKIEYITIQQYVNDPPTGTTLLNSQGVQLTQSDYSSFMLHARAVENMLLLADDKTGPTTAPRVAAPRRRCAPKRKRVYEDAANSSTKRTANNEPNRENVPGTITVYSPHTPET